MDALLDVMEVEEVDDSNFERQLLQDSLDPFRVHDELNFIKHFRLTKEIVHTLIQRLESHFEPTPNLKGADIPGHLQALVALRYMATGNFYISSDVCLDFCPSAVSKCVKSFCTGLVSLTQEYIMFPDVLEQKRVMGEFFAIASMPAVIGCVDCTQIWIPNPGGPDGDFYRSRPTKYSINVQGVCDAKLKFTNIVCSWPGSVHDSRIFRNSNLCQYLERNHQDGTYQHLLGDNKYPCLKYLLTPLPNARTDKEKHYNAAHKKTRNTIECSFRVLKRRFPCLIGIVETELDTTKKLIMSCAILHNIAITDQIPLLDEDEHSDSEDEEEEDAQEPASGHPKQQNHGKEQGQGGYMNQGFTVRAAIVENCF